MKTIPPPKLRFTKPKLTLFANFFCFAFFFFGIAQMAIAQNATEKLTNYTIINMVKKKIGSKLIISKIKTTPCQFDVTLEAIVFLKDNKVSEEIINEMVQREAALQQEKKTLQDAAALLAKQTETKEKLISKIVDFDLSTMTEPGFYFFSADNKQLVKMPKVQVQTKNAKGVNKVIKDIVTVGLAANSESKYDLQLPSASARMQLLTPNPVFFFLASIDSANTIADPKANPTLLAVDSFKLVTLKRHNNYREIKTKNGEYTDLATKLKTIAVSPGLYKITLETSLPSGEYCFYTGDEKRDISPLNTSDKPTAPSIKVYDFGVRLRYY